MTHDPADETRHVGRGALYLTATKFWFMVSGYIIVFVLPRVFTGKGDYGDWATTAAFVTILSQCLFQGTTQAVSRFVGRDATNTGGVLRGALRLQTCLAGGTFVAFAALSPLLARHVYGAPRLTKAFLAGAFIILFQAFYAVYLGALNGEKRFRRQAAVDFTYSTARVLLIAGGAFVAVRTGALDPVVAAVAGFAATALVVLLTARAALGRRTAVNPVPPRDILRFQIFTVIFSALTTFAVQGDILMLRAFLGSGADGGVVAGHYEAARKLAQIPYSAVAAIVLVMFPLVSEATGRSEERLRGSVREAARWALLVAAAAGGLFVLCPRDSVFLLFPARLLPAADALPILAAGYVGFAVWFVLASALSASGRPWMAVRLGIVLAVSETLLCVLLVRFTALGAQGAAMATAGSMVLATLLGVALVRRVLGVTPSAVSALRILAAGAVAGGVARGILAIFARDALDMRHRLLTLAAFAAGGVAYVVTLVVLGEFTAEDRARFRRILGR